MKEKGELSNNIGLAHFDEIREETIVFEEPYSKYLDEKIRGSKSTDEYLG